MNPPSTFRTLLKRRGYSDKAVEEIGNGMISQKEEELITEKRKLRTFVRELNIFA
jgi:hypothetical protein